MLNALSLTGKAQAKPVPPFVYYTDAIANSLYRVRRRIVGQWRRFLTWEFWPPYLFYPPVVAYIAYLGIRFRNWTLFTAANPAIPAGGFVGESKYQILGKLDRVPDFMLVSSALPETMRIRMAMD